MEAMKANNMELATASKIRSAGIGLVINTAPNMVLVNGLWCGNNFQEFKKFCTKHKIEQKNFANWPFIFNLDGTQVETKNG